MKSTLSELRLTARFTSAILLIFLFAASQNMLLSKPSGVHFSNGTVEMPVTITEGRILVPASIDGAGERFFILDTAASVFAISPSLEKRLEIRAEDVKSDTLKGASGTSVIEIITLPSVRFGGEVFDGVEAVVADIPDFKTYDGKEVVGILGVNVLRHFDVEFRLNEKRVLLHQNGEMVIPAAGYPFESKSQPGFVELPIELNGHEVQAVLDSGAKRSVLNTKAANFAGISKEKLSAAHKKESKGIDGNGNVVSSFHTVDQISVGNAKLVNPEVKVSDLPVFHLLGMGEGPAMLIGMDLLKACNVAIDYGENQLHLCYDATREI